MGNALQGRVALVTGSSRGIGAAIARRFAAEGARVAVHGRDREALAGACREGGGDRWQPHRDLPHHQELPAGNEGAASGPQRRRASRC